MGSAASGSLYTWHVMQGLCCYSDFLAMMTWSILRNCYLSLSVFRLGSQSKSARFPYDSPNIDRGFITSHNLLLTKTNLLLGCCQCSQLLLRHSSSFQVSWSFRIFTFQAVYHHHHHHQQQKLSKNPTLISSLIVSTSIMHVMNLTLGDL